MSFQTPKHKEFRSHGFTSRRGHFEKLQNFHYKYHFRRQNRKIPVAWVYFKKGPFLKVAKLPLYKINIRCLVKLENTNRNSERKITRKFQQLVHPPLKSRTLYTTQNIRLV